MDVMTREQRSRCMSRIRGRDTKPELVLRKAVWALGGRYRLAYPVPGRPDLVFPGPKLAVFVDGCFWHGCPEHGAIPKTNNEFWASKLNRNKERDVRVTAQLRESGWTVLRYWEHQVLANADEVTARVLSALNRRM